MKTNKPALVLCSVALAAVLLFTAACGKGNGGTATSASSTSPSSTAAPVTSTVPSTTAVPNDPASFAKGAELLKKDNLGGLKIGMTNTELEQIMGKPDEATPPVVWESDGLQHTIWYFEGYTDEIELSGEGDSFKIVNIISREGSQLKTANGIGIGSSEDDVKTGYAEYINEEQSNETGYVCGSIYSGVIFGIESGKVVSIQFGAISE